MAKQDSSRGRQWYVIHTYSGYEESVAHNLRQRIESMDMQDKIYDVLVPKETVVVMKNGKKTVKKDKIFPGYVLVSMVVADDSWYVVRNTPNVTGFIGTGNTPTPISDDEIRELQKRMGVEEPSYKVDLSVGDEVKVQDGAFKDFVGKIAEVDQLKARVKVLINMFGRETAVELDPLQVTKVQ